MTVLRALLGRPSTAGAGGQQQPADVRAGLEPVLAEAVRLADREVEGAQDLVDLLRGAMDASPAG